MARDSLGSFKTPLLFKTLILTSFLNPGETLGITHWLENVIQAQGAEIVEYNTGIRGFAELPLQITQRFSIRQKYMLLSNSNSTLPLPSIPVKYIPSTNRWIFYMNLRVEDFARIPTSWSILVGNNIVLMEGQTVPSSPTHLIPLIPAKYVMIVIFQGGRVTQCYGMDVTGTNYANLPLLRELQNPWVPHNRGNFHMQPLIWGASQLYFLLIPELKERVHEEKVGRNNQMLNMMVRIGRELNATLGVLRYDFYTQNLRDLEAHISPVVLLTPEFLKFGPPIIAGNWDGVEFLVRKPYPLKSEARLSFELIVGQPVPLFLSMISSALVAWVCLVQSGGPPSVRIPNILGKMWTFVAEICYGQPLPNDPARSHGARFARIPFLLASLLITSLKQTEYVTHLTATELHYPPRSMEGLNEALDHDGYNISWYGITNSPYQKLLDKRVLKRWEAFYPQNFRMDQADVCLETLLKKDKHACLGSRKVAQAAMNVFQGASFSKSTDGSAMIAGAMYVRGSMQHILDSVRQVITMDSEAGLHLNFMDGAFANLMKGRNSSIDKEDNTEEQIRISDSWLPMSVALAVSMVVFMSEIMWVKIIQGATPPVREVNIVNRVEVQARRSTEFSIDHIWVA